MAHLMNEIMDNIEGKKSVLCNPQCKNWAFPHLDRACILSEIYSVQKGRPCFIFEQKPATPQEANQ